MGNAIMSIVIPTLNEEAYVGRLLESIREQDFKNYEIIVSDWNSFDRTAEIAKSYGATVLNSPKKGPGAQRNFGARHAKGEVLVFFDADVVLLKKDTFSEILRLFQKKNVIGGFVEYTGEGGTMMDNMCYRLSSDVVSTFLKKNGFLPGAFTFVRKKHFEMVGGYNEDMQFNEDHDLGKRLIKVGELKTVKRRATTSVRRLVKDGYANTIKNYMGALFFYLINKDLPKNIKFQPASSLGENK